MSNIVRLEKNKENPYTVVSNELADNNALSYAARGLMLYLLSKPDSWTVRMTDLERSGTEGRGRVISIFKELEAAGYVKRSKLRGADGRWAYETTIYETPREPTTETESPHTENRMRETVYGKPHAENRIRKPAHVVSTEVVSTDKQYDTEPKELAPCTTPPATTTVLVGSRSSPYILAGAIASVCNMDLAANKGRLCAEAKRLSLASLTPTPEEIRQRYGANGWWFHSDWRGKKGQLPTPATIRETWGKWSASKVPRATVGSRHLSDLPRL